MKSCEGKIIIINICLGSKYYAMLNTNLTKPWYMCPGRMGKVQCVAGGGSGWGDGYPCLEVHYKHVI